MKNSKYWISRLVLLALITSGVIVIVIGCHHDTANGDKPKPIIIGMQNSPAMLLVMVAKEQGFFNSECGRDVELKEFTAGKFALQTFLSGSLDYAVSGDVPVCLATLQGNQPKVIAQVVAKTTNEVRVVANKDNGLTDPAAYFNAKKRKLATSFGGGPEFYTVSFLKHYHIRKDQVELIAQKPEDMPAALATGSVDAISIFDPFAYIAEKKLGNNSITFSDSSIYSEYYVLVGRDKDMQSNAKLTQGLLRALLKAQESVAANPEAAKQIMVKYTKLDRDVVDGIWPNFEFKLALTPGLIQVWDKEAAWAKETAIVTPDTEIPDFKQSIDARYLREVDPTAIVP